MSTLGATMLVCFIIFNYFSRYWGSSSIESTKYSFAGILSFFNCAGKFHLPAQDFCIN